MMKRTLVFAVVCALALIGVVIAADEACPAQIARSDIALVCAEQPQNSLCAMQPTVSAVALDAAGSVNLAAAGDRVAASAMDWFSVSSEANTWGMARMRYPAYANDSLDAQTVSLLAFGDAALFQRLRTEMPGVLQDMTVSARAGANLRAGPDTSAEVMRTIAYNSAIKAIRRSDAGDWIQAYAAPTQIGWLSQSVVAGDARALPAESPANPSAPIWQPWQHFDFRSGLGDAACIEGSESGLLLQTPKAQSPRQFWINGVDIQLRGSAFLQAQMDAGMRVHVLEGQATISIDGGILQLNGGFASSVALKLDANDLPLPADAPDAPSAYDYEGMMRLPVNALPESVQVTLDPYSIIQRRPGDGGDPLAALPSDAPCQISAPTLGANIRSKPDPTAPVIAVLGHRESATPLARKFGSDAAPWWKLAEHVWIRIDAANFGGDCASVPLITE